MKKQLTLLFSFAFLALALLMPRASYSQAFNMFQLDDSEYPIIKGTFVAKNFVGDYFDDLTVDDFDVFENDENFDETISISCTKVEEEQPLSVVLMLESSGSMREVVEDNETRIQWAMEACRKFIDSLKYGPPGALKVIGFAGAFDESQWFTEYEPLDHFLRNLAIQPGAVDYNPPFDAALTALESRPSNMRKIILCVYDGPPTATRPFHWENRIPRCRQSDIEVYGVNLVYDFDGDFSDFTRFANQTGGKNKVVFTKNKKDLINALKTKAYEIQGYREVCKLIWESQQPCDINEVTRNVKVRFHRSTFIDSSMMTYNAPEPPTLEFSNDIIFFSDDPAYSSQNAEIIARNDKIVLNSFEFSEEGIFTASISTPYEIQEDSPFSFTIDYIEDPVTDPQIIELSFGTDPCPVNKTIKLITNSSMDAKDTIDFDKVDIGETTEKEFECVVKNIMPVPVTGSCELTGSGIAEMEIIEGGGAFTLEPDECLDVKIKYARTSGGKIDVKLDYGLPLVFGEPRTVVTMDTSMTDVEEIITENNYYLADNYPNPAENITNIEYYLPVPQPVHINIYNIYGEKIKALVGGAIQSGVNNVQFNADELSSGIYIYELRTPTVTLNKRMIINK